MEAHENVTAPASDLPDEHEATKDIGRAAAKAPRKTDAPKAKPDRTLSHRVVEAAKEPGQAPGGLKWRQHAGITVFFDCATDDQGRQSWQTRVYHNESGDETHFPGFETTPWVDWILRRAGLPGVRPNVCVEILDVDVTEIESPMGDSPRSLAATIEFRLSGPDAKALQADGTPYHVEVHALNRDRRIWELLATRHDRLQPDVAEYVCSLESPMPDLGDYELRSVVLLLPPDNLVSCHQSSIVHVVL